MNNQPSISIDCLRTFSSSSTTSRYLVYILHTLHLRNILLFVNFHIFWIEYKNASFYSSDVSFKIQGDNSKYTLMTSSLTSSDDQQKKPKAKFERWPSEKTPPPAEPNKNCTGPVVMAIPAPKQEGSLIEHVVKTIKVSVSDYTCNHQQNAQTGNYIMSTNFVERK